jgi:hypothetical protein
LVLYIFFFLANGKFVSILSKFNRAFGSKSDSP